MGPKQVVNRAKQPPHKLILQDSPWSDPHPLDGGITVEVAVKGQLMAWYNGGSNVARVEKFF